MKCIYCHFDIDTDEFGWGWIWEDYEKQGFHCECIQQVEDLRIEEY